MTLDRRRIPGMHPFAGPSIYLAVKYLRTHHGVQGRICYDANAVGYSVMKDVLWKESPTNEDFDDVARGLLRIAGIDDAAVADPAGLVLFVFDGLRSVEKRETHAKRDANVALAKKSLEKLDCNRDNRVAKRKQPQGPELEEYREQHRKNTYRYDGARMGQRLVEAIGRLGQEAEMAEAESDPMMACIAREEGSLTLVSNDGDALAHYNMRYVIRPVSVEFYASHAGIVPAELASRPARNPSLSTIWMLYGGISSRRRLNPGRRHLLWVGLIMHTVERALVWRHCSTSWPQAASTPSRTLVEARNISPLLRNTSSR